MTFALLFVTLSDPIAPVPEEEYEDEHGQHQNDDDSSHQAPLQNRGLLHIARSYIGVAIDGKVLLHSFFLTFIRRTPMFRSIFFVLLLHFFIKADIYFDFPDKMGFV